MKKRKTPEKSPQDRDDENPKWTKADFARAKYGGDMPDAIKKSLKIARTKGS